MIYNKQQLRKTRDQKVLRKVKKNWVFVSLATFMTFGSVYEATQVGNVAADNVTSQQFTNSDGNAESTETQKAEVTFMEREQISNDQILNQSIESVPTVSLSGKADTDTGYNTKDTIAKLIAEGYQLVSDDTKGQNVILGHDNQTKKYTVTLTKDKLVQLNPDNPPKEGDLVPGYDNVKYPKVNLNHVINQTIKYVDQNGQELAPSVTDTVTWQQGALFNVTTGEVIYGQAILPKDGKTTFTAKTSPVIKGYHLANNDQKVIAAVSTKADSPSSTQIVTYVKDDDSTKGAPTNQGNGGLIPDLPTMPGDSHSMTSQDGHIDAVVSNHEQQNVSLSDTKSVDGARLEQPQSTSTKTKSENVLQTLTAAKETSALPDTAEKNNDDVELVTAIALASITTMVSYSVSANWRKRY